MNIKLVILKEYWETDFNFGQIAEGDWLLYNEKHIEELKLQKYKFPDFALLNTMQFKKIACIQ